MTLDEAIKHAEEVAKEKYDEAQESIMCNRFQYADNCRDCAEEHEQLAKWLKELKQLRNQTSWIPVSERLPDNNDEYLVIDADGNFGVGYYREDAKAWDSCNWGWLERLNSADDTCPTGMSKVIAWMPLPEAYKEA